ncbi:MAG: zinc-ribbon domain-containing protein [Oscillospiraceae bacterium]|nr:zinc-ribbon domain-containing protein [Oscillospiraceae bacterium]
MICKHCGNNVDDNMAFCGFCGAKLERPIQEAQYQQSVQPQYQQPAQPQYQQPAQQAEVQHGGVAVKSRRSKKPLIILLIALAVLVAGGAVAMFLIFGNSTDSSGYTSAILTKMGVVYNGKLVEDSGGVNQFLASSLSGDTFAVKDADKRCVCVLKNGKLIRTNVNTENGIGLGFSLAASGNGIAYYTADLGVELMDTNTGEITVIEESGNYTGVTISPDGKTVAYSDSKTIFLYTNGESKKLMSANMFLGVVAVADEGKYVFAYNLVNDFTLYCLDSTGEILSSTSMCMSPFVTNKDNTQVTYRMKEGDKAVYIYDAVKDETYSYPYSGMFTKTRLPVGEFIYDTDYNLLNSMTSNGSMYPTMHFNIEDLTHCLSFDGGLYQLDGDDSKEISLNGQRVRHVATMADGGIVYLTCNDSLSDTTYSLVLEKDGETDDVGVVDGFGVSPSGKTIFYFTQDGRLMQYRNGESREIAENVCTENYFVGLDQIGVGIPTVLGDDVIVYPGNDSQWYIYKKGKTEPVPGEIPQFYNTANGIYINPTGYNIRIGKNSLYFFTDTYLVYQNDSDLFIIDPNGNTSPLE